VLVGLRAVSGDLVALVVDSAEAPAGSVGGDNTALVPGGSTVGNSNAGVAGSAVKDGGVALRVADARAAPIRDGVSGAGHVGDAATSVAPDLSRGGADAVATSVVVVGAGGVSEGAIVGSGAPGVVAQQGVAATAAVVGGGATDGDADTGVVGGAEGEASLGADAVTAVVEVGAVGLGDALPGGGAPGEGGGGGDAVAAAIVSDAARGDGDAGVGHGAPALAETADAVTTVVVVVEAPLRDLNTGGARTAPNPAGFDGQAGTTAVVQLAASGDGDASVVLGADGEAIGADRDAHEEGGVGLVAGGADQTLQVVREVAGGLVPDAVGDEGQASLTIIGGNPAWEALRAGAVSVVDGLAVGDQANAEGVVGDQEVVSGAGRAEHGTVAGVGQVGDAEGNAWGADEAVGAEDVPSGAGPAAVGSGLVDDAVRDPGQARGPVIGEAGEGAVAENAQTEAVVLDAVDDGSWDARAPVGGLSVAKRAPSTNVCTNNVLVAVGNGLETPVLNQDVAGSAGAADSGGGVSGVEGAADDVGDELAGVSEGQVEPLLAVDATTLVVNGDAGVAREPDASVPNLVVEVSGVALGAVLVTVPSEATSLRNGLLGSGSDQEEAESQLEQVVHVYCQSIHSLKGRVQNKFADYTLKNLIEVSSRRSCRGVNFGRG